MPIIMTFDASDFALGPEDEGYKPTAKVDDAEALAPAAEPAHETQAAEALPPPLPWAPSAGATGAPPPPVGAMASLVVPKAISVVREKSRDPSPLRRDSMSSRNHGNNSPAGRRGSRDTALSTDAPTHTSGTESLRELRVIVARHEQQIEAQRRAIAELESLVGRLMLQQDAAAHANGGKHGLASPPPSASSVVAAPLSRQLDGGAGAPKPDLTARAKPATPRSAGGTSCSARRSSACGGGGSGGVASGGALAYERRLSASAPKLIDSLSGRNASPGRRASDEGAQSVRYAVRGRYVSEYGPTGFNPTDNPLLGQPPEIVPQLEHVYGYRTHTPGLNVNNPLVVVSADVVVYAAARLCVVLDSAANAQTFYGRHDEDVLCVAAAPPTVEGAVFLASGEIGRRPSIHIWCLAGCEQAAVLPDTQHERGISLLAFSPDGQWLASVGLDNHRTLVLWDWRRQVPLVSTKVRRLCAPPAPPAMCCLPCVCPHDCSLGSHAAPARGTPRLRGHPLPRLPFSLARRALTRAPARAHASRRPTATQAHNEPLFAMAFHLTDPHVLSVAGVKAYKVFKIEVPPSERSSAALPQLAAIAAPALIISKRTGVFGKVGCAIGGQPQTLLCIAYTPDGQAATGCASGDVLIWQGQEVQTKLRGAHDAPVYSVASLPGAQLVSGDKHGVLALWDSSHAHLLSRALDDRQQHGCDLPAIRSLVALGGRGGAEGAGGGQADADVGVSSSSVLVGCSDGSIREIALSTGVAQVWMQAHASQGALTGLATDPTDASRFASCATDRTVRVWSAGNRWPISSCTLSEEAFSVDWHPQGDRLAVGLLNGSVLVLKADSLEPLASVKRREVRAPGAAPRCAALRVRRRALRAACLPPPCPCVFLALAVRCCPHCRAPRQRAHRPSASDARARHAPCSHAAPRRR